MTDEQFWQAIIEALLAVVTAIERWRNISPTTCELRRAGKSKFR